MNRLGVVGVLVLAVFPGHLPAQRAPAAGTRVRVWIGAEISVGVVTEATRDTLVISEDGQARTIAVASIRRLEVSRGARSRARTGATLGALLGALAGGGIGAAADPQYGVLAGVPLGLIGGLLVGAGVGSSVLQERWEVAYESTGGTDRPPAADDSPAGRWNRAALGQGQRVRVQARESERWASGIGTIKELRNDTLVVRLDSDHASWEVPLSHVGRLDLSEGTRRHPIRGAAIGFGIGALVDPENEHAMVYIGPAVGAVLGYLARTERWRENGADRLHLGVAPRARGGLLISASVAF